MKIKIKALLVMYYDSISINWIAFREPKDKLIYKGKDQRLVGNIASNMTYIFGLSFQEGM